MKDIKIRIATKDDVDMAAKILSESFYHDPFFTWAVDNPADRLQVVGDYYRLYINLCLTNGVTHLAYTEKEAILGVAVWLPNYARDDKLGKELEHKLGIYAPKFMEFGELSYAYEPQNIKFDQLLGFGVVPSAVGSGIGSALLAYHQKNLDKIGLPSYLEASSRLAAGGVYGRAGYQPVGDPMPITTGVVLYPMWRPVQKLGQALLSHVAPRDQDHKHPMLGSLITFGNIDWRVLDVHNHEALLLSDKILETRRFHHELTSVDWSSCSLRHYLNTELYQIFDQEEQSRIVEIDIPNHNNPWFKTDGGSDTLDNIFLLSIEEVVRYFGDSRQLRDGNANTKYFIDDHFNIDRKTVDSSSWWLRTVGSNPNFVANVTKDGRISVSGDFVNRNNNGVRPAMWIKI